MYVDVRRARSPRSSGVPDQERIVILPGYEIVVSAADREWSRAAEALLAGEEPGGEGIHIRRRTPHGEQVWRLTRKVAPLEVLREHVRRLRLLGAEINVVGLDPLEQEDLARADGGGGSPV